MRCNIETDRLILRNLVPEDYEAAFKWCGDPDVNEYMIYHHYRNTFRQAVLQDCKSSAFTIWGKGCKGTLLSNEVINCNGF